MIARTPVKRKRTGKPRRGPMRDPKYLAWIRKLLCVVCFRSSWVEMLERGEIWKMNREYNCYTRADAATEAAHVGQRGIGQKCSDRETIPLCGFHHRTGGTSHHRLQKKFWAHWEIDRDALIAALNARFMEEQGK